MRTLKLALMVVVTSIIAGVLTLIAMLLTTSGRTEYVDYTIMTAYAWWLAIFCLCILTVPATLAMEPSTRAERWPYVLISLVVSVGTTALLDGPTQFISYIYAIIVGLICGLIWAALAELLKPWNETNA